MTVAAWFAALERRGRAVRHAAMTCENCGEPIVLEGSYWTHRDTDRVTCWPGSEQCAQPRSG